MLRSANRPATVDGRLKRLAARIDELARKDEQHQRRASDIAALRVAAAAEIHAICRDFVDSVNELSSEGALVLDPPEFSPRTFEPYALNLIQISVRGRILQFEHSATGDLTSTEDFRVPYTLNGSVRAFNQESLSKDLIEEQHLFYTVEKHKKMWRFFDARTYRSGPFDKDFLISLMEELL